jgi:glycosyltransferase involved in cell wall biosynthesis
MNIAYIAPDFLPSNNAGSVRNSFFVDILQKDKHNVFVFSSNENNKYQMIVNKTKLPSNKDNNIIRLLKEIGFSLEMFFRIIFYKKMDLYIISSPPFFVTIFAFMAAKIRNKNNVILDIRDIYPEVFFADNILSEKGFTGRVLKKIEKYMYKNSREIVTVTKGLKQLIINSSIQENKIHLIRNGYDANFFKYSDIKYDVFTVVFHGVMGKFQNIELLADIIERMEEDEGVRFLVIGNGCKDYLIKNMRNNNLEYHDSVNYVEVNGYISKAHIGLSLRTDGNIGKTAFPVKVFEYIGVGLPIIVTPISEAGEVVEGEKIGLQYSNDINKIINGIYHIKDNYTQYTDKSRLKNKKFSRQFEGRKLLAVVENVIKC